VEPAALLRLTDLLGVAVFAISGALAAGRKSLDLLGVVVIATVTAIGGGTTRDVLLDRHPVFWIADPMYLIVIGITALGTVVYARRYRVRQDALAIADALGLAFFVIGGAQIAESLALPAISVIVMGVITGTFGGLVRDVLTNEIPMILSRGELYATTAIVGVGSYLLLTPFLPRSGAALVGMVVIVALRLAAILWGLRLPVFTLRDEQEE
jgi:uncharacterized membrane protein YeiH